MELDEEHKSQAATAVIAASEKATAVRKSHGPRFWGIFVALCLLAFISALDVAIITTALPRVTADIEASEQDYVWIANSFVVASSVIQPLTGQLADILGRRIPLITATALFALGSGISGGAHNVAMMIGGRTVQGLGAGGVYVLLDIVCCDLVPLRERGKYLGLMNSWAGVAAGIGPVVGGALAEANWRWIFYMNVPICAVALGVILLFMRVKTGARDPNHSKLQQVDWLGNAIFISSMISLLLGLVMGGIQHPWSSWRIILPIILGAIGWAVFHIQQALPSTKWPSVPPRLFKNRTSATAFILTFMASVLVNSAAYFLPVWFQAVLSNSVLQAGINFLPLAISTLFFAVIGGILLTKFGAYRPLHALSFALTAIGFGLLTILSPEKARWATFQLIMGAGMGIHVSTMLPAIMASLSEADVAASAAVYCFIRTFGYIWGVTMPSIIFNAMVNRNLYHVSDDWLREQLRDGGAYSFASQLHELRPGLTDESFRELVAVYTKSLNVIWWVSMGISIASLCGVAGEEGLELRSELETEYGIEERKEAAE